MKEQGPAANGAPNTTDEADTAQRSGTGSRPQHHRTASREIDWYRVYRFVEPFLRSCPYPGTPAWCALSDHDPAKMAAVLLAGELWSLNESARADAMRQASRDVSAAYDWAVIGRRIREHERFYHEKPYLRRTLTHE